MRQSSSRPSRHRLRGATTLLLLVVGTQGIALARPLRRFFEPTDLGLEDPGTVEVDLQTGLVRGGDAYRVAVPDFEIDVGLSRAVEFDIDGAAAFEDSSGPSFTFDQLNPDNLWASLKVPLLDVRDAAAGWGVGSGMQLGPKLPVARGAGGVGIEGLSLVGFMTTSTQVTLNLGGLVDPASSGHRPAAVEGGLDVASALDTTGRWWLTVQLGGMFFVTSDPDQLTLSGGVAFNFSDMLQLSVSAFGGPLADGDRYGLLLGVSPKLRVWDP